MSVPSLFPLGTPVEKEAEAPAKSDVCPTPEKCTAQLKGMLKDPKREWVGQPQSPEAYATGTRLFAYRALRKKLTCGELERALKETSAATSLLQPATYDRVRALNADVTRELKAEHDKRCVKRR